MAAFVSVAPPAATALTTAGLKHRWSRQAGENGMGNGTGKENRMGNKMEKKKHRERNSSCQSRRTNIDMFLFILQFSWQTLSREIAVDS